jgi:hypothetical protein
VVGSEQKKWKDSERGLRAVGEDILFKFMARERRKKYIKRSLRRLDSELPLQNYLTPFESSLDLNRDFHGISYIISIRGYMEVY